MTRIGCCCKHDVQNSHQGQYRARCAKKQGCRDESWRRTFGVGLNGQCILPIHPEDKQALLQHLSRPSAMEEKGAENWLQQVTAEVNSLSWMDLAHDGSGPILTRRGTRPGSSLARVTFGLLLRRHLGYRRTLRPEHCTSPTPVLRWDGIRSFSPTRMESCEESTLEDIVSADDLANCLCCESAASLPTVAGTEAGCLSDAFAEHGLNLAFATHKTAAMCMVRGEKSRSVRRHLVGGCAEEQTTRLPVLREHGPCVDLPLVSSHRHLGIIQISEGSIKQELHQRVGQTWAAFREGRRKLFRCKKIALAKNEAFLQGMVLSKLLVGSGAWPPLKAGEARVFQACVMSLYRQILCLPKEGNQHMPCHCLRLHRASQPCYFPAH